VSDGAPSRGRAPLLPGLRATRALPLWLAAAALLATWLAPVSAHAYVGPGAGIAVATTVLAFVVSVLAVLLGLLLWPIRFVIRRFTRKRPPRPPRIRRAVLIGLDGLDPELVQRFMSEGRLPNMKRLAEAGMLSRLGTTYPAMSPVAWSSFATGVDPAKHGIFDFLTRDPKSYQPDLSSADVRPPRRHIRLGSYRIPVGKPELKLMRKSRPFWDVLGRYQVPCSILRVPITFPAEKFYGNMLSAMCVPDLQGTQGSFTYFTSDTSDTDQAIGGQRIAVEVNGDTVASALVGPPNPIREHGKPVRLPFEVRLDRAAGQATLRIGGKTLTLRPGEYTDWVPVAFPLGLGLKLRGICRFRLLAMEPSFRLYVTPINIDPENPVLPISHPRFFSVFLSKLIGRYATLGLAEDTWALNEGVLDEDAFLEQAWANHREREDMFFEMLERTPRGLITCVFDGTDRIQHMFMRYLDEAHPALAHKSETDERRERYRDVIPDTYARMDEMLGRVLERVDLRDPETLVTVLSDHGFQTFRRGVNLNAWLHQNGYLALEEGRTESGEWFRGVDWSRTRAFAVGLGGIFLNIQGREAQGIVPPEQAQALADELAARLSGLLDTDLDQVAVREVYPAHRLYKGPYADDAPDLIVGYAVGWRASWDGVRGIVNATIFDDNTKAWSGDHCIDPELVPGVLITNHAWNVENRKPVISDMAPTLLDLFGVPAPRYMDGKSLAPS
jgi:predicted AlkP superfamily phosphohydrolase/phosphomutase